MLFVSFCSFPSLSAFGPLGTSKTEVVEACERTLPPDHPRRLAALKAHFVSPVRQLKNRLQVVIAVRAPASHMEEKVEFGW